MQGDEHTLWVEKWRPTTLDGYVGNDHVREKLAQYLETGDIPHLLFHGPPGTGKTTAAKLLVNTIDCDYLFINASDERGIDMIRDRIKTFAASMGFSPLKIVVLDECDHLTADAQAALRNTMEVFSKSTRFILTANYVERITPPLVSRCQTMPLTPPSKRDVAVRITQILDAEQVAYTTEDIVLLVKAYYPDIRLIINTAQLHTVGGKLAVTPAEIIGADVSLPVLDILKSKQTPINKVTAIRKVLVDAGLRDYIPLYRTLYDHVLDYMPPDNVPNAIIQIAEGQYRDAFVPDKEVTFMATLYRILID